MANYVQWMRKTAATWTSTNPTLLAGQIGVESDTLKAKIGDGATAWTSLAYMWDAAGSGVGTFQPLDSDLTTVAGLSPSDDDVLQRKAGAWVNRTIAQVKTDLALVKGDVGLGNVDNTSDATKNAATATLTNKRVTKRVGTVASSATPTINTDDVDAFNITALATAITSMTTNLSGTPTDHQTLIIRIKDNGNARTITWGASFQSSGVAALLAATLAGKTHTVGLEWDAAVSKWICLAVDATGY